ncbi:uncharacterized protein C8R40DRAFT_1065057 [Lentinula edodes]|uniref:uncharacterized protein n=1 Tax=Lentinula edodes TaxID=5353 RepID=UPI001E8CD798|nr:uncharacterized protein C8R40DRAFT_1065057 [Lentinula edodes]KAH7881372.1 hypothetical protein C8R40DRAFT_1065057 [Lentinula edodes]
MSHLASPNSTSRTTAEAIYNAGISLQLNLEKAQPALYCDLDPLDCLNIIRSNEYWRKLALQQEHGIIFEAVYEQLNAGVTISSLLNPSSATVRHPTLRVEDVVEDFLKSMEEPMKGYLKENRLPEWTLPESALAGLNERERQDVLAHVRSLGIPARSNSPQCPDMLLHNLGKIIDGELLESIKKIFENEEPCLLLSTSGSGKTRTILEGLTRHWGFYFVCARDDNGLGSSDLSSMINDGLTGDENFTLDLSSVEHKDSSTFLTRNRSIARQHFFEVFLARLVIFTAYLEAVFGPDAPARSESDNYKKMWLILQLKPHLGGVPDIFDDFSKTLYEIHAPQKDLAHVAQRCAHRIVQLLRDNLAIVMDESQIAAVTHDLAFKSGPDDPTPIEHSTGSTGVFRPVLREIQGNFYSTYITHTLDDCDAHRRYVEKYFPLKLVKSLEFEHLFDRIRHWLRGSNTVPANRYLTEMKRGKSPLVANLIQYVYKYFMTSMPPFAFTAKEIEFVKYGFARYTIKDEDVIQMEGAFQQEDSVLLVPTIHISEPLILLALALWANRNHNLWIIGPLHYVLTTEITNHDVVKGNGLEKYIAYYFATVLARKEGCRLGEILHFHGRTKLMNSTAKLVAVNVLRNGRDMDESIDDYSSATILNKLNVVPPAPTKGDVISEGAFISCTAETNVPDLSHCTSVLGRQTQQPEEVLNWLLFRHRNAICFPDNHFGPDLIFVLKLLDPKPTYIWVVVQCKLRLSTKTLSKKSVQDSLNTLAPTKFYIDKNGEPYSPKSLPMLPERTLEAMSFLPHRNTELAGPYSVLRIICPFPAPMELDRIPSQDDEEEDEDEDDEDIGQKREEGGQIVTDAGRKFSLCTDPDDLGHPLATLNIEKMINVMDQFIPENKLAAILAEKGQKVEYAAALANKRAIALDKEARQYIDQRKLTKAKGINEAVKRTRGSSKKRIERKKSTAGTAKDGAIGKADAKRNRKSTVSTRQPVESGSHALPTGNAEKKRKRTTSANSVAETELAQRNAGTMKLRTLPQKSRRP